MNTEIDPSVLKSLPPRKRKQLEARVAGVIRDMEQIQNVNRINKFVRAESIRADIFRKQKKVRFVVGETKNSDKGDLKSGTGETKKAV